MTRICDMGRRGLDRLAGVYEGVCMALLGAMLAINMLNIAVRGVFDVSLNWVWPWTMVAFLCWVMLAFFPLYQRRKDVSIYLVLRYLPGPAQRALGIFVSLAIMAGAGLLIWTFPERLASMRGSIEMTGLPRRLLIWPLLLSAVPMFLGAALDVVRLVAGEDYAPFGIIAVTPVPE